jgi:hypothetical protein
VRINLTKKEKELFLRLAILIAVLFGTFKGMEYVGAQYSTTQQQENRKLKSEHADFTARLAAINEEEQLQQQFATSYLEFAKRGVIGDEERLNWISQIQEIANKRRLYNLNYSIANRVSHPAVAFAFTEKSTIQIQSTMMKISLPMLHDLDFLMFLEDYAQNVEGTFVPFQCTLSRSNQEPFEVELKENLKADCTLEWLTVADPDQGKASGAGDSQQS